VTKGIDLSFISAFCIGAIRYYLAGKSRAGSTERKIMVTAG
jgi:hypothetical protein